MAISAGKFFSDQFAQGRDALRKGLRVLQQRGPSQIQFWFIALVIGIAAGFAALGFRKSIDLLQSTLYRTDDVRLLHTHAEYLPWYWVLLVCVLTTKLAPCGVPSAA